MKTLINLILVIFISTNALAQNGVYHLNLTSGDNTTSRDDNATAFDNALGLACVKGGKIVFPPGTYYFSPIKIIDCPNIEITGNGTKIVYRPLNTVLPNTVPQAEQHFFVFSHVNNCKINNLEIKNIGAKSERDVSEPHVGCYISAQGAPSSNSGSIYVLESSNMEIRNCTLIEGGHGIIVENSTGTPDNMIIVSDNLLKNQRGYAMFFRRVGFCIVQGNIMEHSGSDGMKTLTECHNMTITNNISKENGRDGYDFYNGLTNSIVNNNQAINNCYQGFDIKGKPANGIYVVTDLIVSSNLARGNGFNGFKLEDVRNITMNSNFAVDNDITGVFFNTVQNFNFTGNTCSKNDSSGVYFRHTTRGIVNGNIAIDNNMAQHPPSDSTAGFHLSENTSGLVISGNVAFNGVYQSGHQDYGMYFDDSCRLNIINANRCTGNAKDAFGGNLIKIIPTNINRGQTFTANDPNPTP